MRVAFYAPMKPPDSHQPSGDRTIGRLLMEALNHAGAEVRLASRLRTWSATAAPDRLEASENASEIEAVALLKAYAREPAWRPDIWVTYHSYYKAPDLLGPKMARRLGIPYVIIEASYSARRADGEWTKWLAATKAGIMQADAIFSFTARDKLGLAGLLPAEKSHDLAPFIDLDGFAKPVPASTMNNHALDHPVKLITVAMMREGAKLQSYRLLASALEELPTARWHLDVVGDGAARSLVEVAFQRSDSQVTFHGACDSAAVCERLCASDAFVWPGVDEAFGMAYLEAQASGLPVVAVHTAGVGEVVRHDATGLLADDLTPRAYARCLERIIEDATLRQRLGDQARTVIEEQHSMSVASRRLSDVLRGLIGGEQR